MFDPISMLWVLGSIAAAADAPEPGRFYKALATDDAVVRHAARAVVVFDEGSGFICSASGHVLTNHHVAELEGSHTYVTLSNGRSLRMTLVATSEALDAALYRRLDPIPAPTWIPLRADPPIVDEPVAVVHHPASLAWRVSYGAVLGSLGEASVGYSAATWWGSSGAPVLDRDGAAVAMHRGWDRAAGDPFSGIPTDQLLAGFPELLDVVSGCEDPASELTVGATTRRRATTTELRGPRACLARVAEARWLTGGRAQIGDPRRPQHPARWDGVEQGDEVTVWLVLEGGREVWVTSTLAW